VELNRLAVEQTWQRMSQRGHASPVDHLANVQAATAVAKSDAAAAAHNAEMSKVCVEPARGRLESRRGGSRSLRPEGGMGRLTEQADDEPMMTASQLASATMRASNELRTWEQNQRAQRMAQEARGAHSLFRGPGKRGPRRLG
jgi:hypothetical protein